MGGAFIGLDEFISARTNKKRLGFEAVVEQKSQLIPNQLLALARPEDLLQYGLIPEFVGRFPILTTLSDLSTEDMIRVLTEPKNALIKQYQALLELDDVQLEFTNGAIKSIASRAVSMKTGARALRSILEQVMLDLMYGRSRPQKYRKGRDFRKSDSRPRATPTLKTFGVGQKKFRVSGFKFLVWEKPKGFLISFLIRSWRTF